MASIQCTRGWRSPLWTGRPLNVVAALALRPKPSVIAGITGDLGGRSTRIGATAFNYTSRTVQTDDVSIILPFQYIYIRVRGRMKKTGASPARKTFFFFFSLFLRFFALNCDSSFCFLVFRKISEEEGRLILIARDFFVKEWKLRRLKEDITLEYVR